MSLLVAEGLTKSFPGTRALDGVDFTLERGEIHVLLGENGAGKSTLIKILSGVQNADSGTVVIDGTVVGDLDPIAARRHGITTIYQEFNLVPDLSVAENVFLGRLPTKGRWLPRIDWRRTRDEAKAFFRRVDIAIDPDRPVGELSIAEQQIVEIAKALCFDAKIIILDEPTATLTRREIVGLFDLLNRLKRQGIGIIYISHRLEEVAEIGDRVTVLRDGRRVGTWQAAERRTEDLIGAMLGHAVDTSGNEDVRAQDSGDVVIEVRNLSDGHKVRDVSLTLRKGEILGLGGLVGAGRTELARAVFGADPIMAGEILVRGRKITGHSCRRSIDLKIGFLPEDRKSEGLLLGFPLKDNISLPSLRRFQSFGFVRRAAERKAAQDYIGRLQIRAVGPDQAARLLSGGNQQKVVLAKWLLTEAEVLIFDEPTRGIDVGAKEEFYRMIMECAARGAAVLLIASEMPELMRLCDRIIVLSKGRISGELARKDFDPERLLSLAFSQSLQ